MIRLVILLLVASPVAADSVVAARTLPARTIIGADDILVRDVAVTGGLSDPLLAIGQEARVALYAGRPIRPGDIGPPAVIDRNQIITLIYSQGGITISTEGRALDRAGPGDFVRIMNLTSRATVTARVDANGIAHVQ